VHCRHLLLSWPDAVCSVDGNDSMSPVSALFWHAAGTDAPVPVPSACKVRTDRPVPFTAWADRLR
jgi:hypothetical protein